MNGERRTVNGERRTANGVALGVHGVLEGSRWRLPGVVPAEDTGWKPMLQAYGLEAHLL